MVKNPSLNRYGAAALSPLLNPAAFRSQTASTNVPSTGDVVGVDYDKIERTASIGALKVSDKIGGLP
jgi:hypothetical protein